MTWEAKLRSDFLCEFSAMCSEASSLVRRIAEPRRVGDSIKIAIGRAADKLGWGYSRTRDVWYGRARRIDATEMDALRKEAANQASRYEAIARAMESTDSCFYEYEIIALVGAARRLRGLPDA